MFVKFFAGYYYLEKNNKINSKIINQIINLRFMVFTVYCRLLITSFYNFVSNILVISSHIVYYLQLRHQL